MAPTTGSCSDSECGPEIRSGKSGNPVHTCEYPPRLFSNAPGRPPNQLFWFVLTPPNPNVREDSGRKEPRYDPLGLTGQTACLSLGLLEGLPPAAAA
ncbi:hypothetical protein Hte_009092 [Hypoxylon texense]